MKTTTKRIAGLGTLIVGKTAATLTLTADASRRLGHASSRLGEDVTGAAWRESKREIAALATERGADRIEVYAQARAGKQGSGSWMVCEIGAAS